MRKVFLLLAIALVFSIVFAESAVGEAKYERLVCESNFAKANVDNVVEVVPSASIILTPMVDSIDEDLISIADYVSEMSDSNKMAQDGLNIMIMEVSQSIRSLNQETQTQVRDGLRAMDNNLRRETMPLLKTDFDELKTEFVECKIEALKKLSLAKVEGLNQIIAAWEERMALFQSKGLDITAMEAIVVEAEAQVIDPLNTAIEAEDTNASRNYCLFNGCDIVNFHFAAKMEAAKLEAIISKIDSNTTDANILAITAQAQIKVDEAQEEIEQLGNNKFPNGENSIWQKLNSAANDIGQVLKPIDSNVPKPPVTMPPEPNNPNVPDINEGSGVQ